MIERRIENLRALDYPPDKLEIVVTSDASSDRTDELAERAGARVVRNPRGGKVAAQNSAVRETDRRDRRVLRRELHLGARRAAKLVRQLRGPRRRLCVRAAATSKPTTAATRKVCTGATSSRCAPTSRALDSVTGGNGSIYAVRRERLRRGRSALRPRPLVPVPDGAARKARGLRAGGELRTRRRRRRTRTSTGARCGCSSTAGRSSSRERCCAASAALSGRGRLAPASALRERRAASRAARNVRRAGRAWRRLSRCARPPARRCSLAALLGVGIARYYVLVTWATVVALWNYVRRGVPATWEVAEGTR